MATTSLKLPDDLKKRVAAASTDLGMTPHAFMVRAIEASTNAAERRADFVSQAAGARKALERTGEGYDADAVHTYLRGRVGGKKAARPRPVSWRG